MAKNPISVPESTRSRIIDHATNEFLRYGVRCVKMDDMATTLGISKRTIYEMFADKEHLLLECMKLLTAKMNQEAEQIRKKSRTPLEAYVRTVDLIIQYSKNLCYQFTEDIVRYPLVVEFFQQGKEERIKKNRHFMQKCVEKGFFREGLNYELLLEYNETANEVLRENGFLSRYSIRDMMITLSDTHVRGLCTAKGIREMNRCIKRLYPAPQSDDVHLRPSSETERK